MEIRLLEAVRREPDGGIAWDFIVAGDYSGIQGPGFIRGATRRWRVITDASLPVVVRDMDLPSRDPEHPRITPEGDLADALKLRVHEEIVRARVAHLTAPQPEPAPEPARGRRRTRIKETAA